MGTTEKDLELSLIEEIDEEGWRVLRFGVPRELAPKDIKVTMLAEAVMIMIPRSIDPPHSGRFARRPVRHPAPEAFKEGGVKAKLSDATLEIRVPLLPADMRD